jgi:hypothetical protein
MFPDGGFAVTGSFTETAVFGPGTPEATLKVAPKDRSAVFVASFSAQRRLRWVRLVHKTPKQAFTHVRAFPDGSVAITCDAGVPAQIEAGGGALHEVPRFQEKEHSSQFFVIRWDAAGTLAWARSFAMQVQNSSHHGLEALPDGGVIAWGRFWGTLRVYPLEQGGVLQYPEKRTGFKIDGLSATAIIRIAPDGTRRWLRAIDWQEPLLATESAVLPDGTLVLTGSLDGSTEPEELRPDRIFLTWVRPEDGSTERVVLGRSLEVPQAPRPGEPVARWVDVYPVRIAALPDGSTAMTAYFGGRLLLDERLPESSAVQSGGDRDMALALFSRSGALRWARVVGSGLEDSTLSEHLRGSVEGVEVYGTAFGAVTFGRGRADARTLSPPEKATFAERKYRALFSAHGALVELESVLAPPPGLVSAECCQRTSWLSLRKERSLPTRNPPQAPEIQAWLDRVIGRVELGWTLEDKIGGLLGPNARGYPDSKDPYWELPSVSLPGSSVPLLASLQTYHGVAMSVVLSTFLVRKEAPTQEEVRRAFEPLPRVEFKEERIMDQYCDLPGHPGVVITALYTPERRLHELTLGGVEGQGCATPEEARKMEEHHRQMKKVREQMKP